MNDTSRDGYIIISNRIVEEVTIVASSGGFCTVRFKDRHGAIRVRERRVFRTK